MIEVFQEIISRLPNLLKTQDNRITSNPIFIVQERKLIYGFDDGYTDRFCWRDEDGEVCIHEGQKGWKALERRHKNGLENKGYLRIGYQEHWEFVTACLTEQGCKDFLKVNKHNLNKTRIYAEGSFRNLEWRAIRAHFLETV